MTNEERTRAFFADWERLDSDLVASYFTEDGIFDNVPSRSHEPPLPIPKGRNAIAEFIGSHMATWSSARFEITNLAVNGDVAFHERVDQFIMDGRELVIEAVGVFEFKDGKIRVWRDYYDAKSWDDQVNQARPVGDTSPVAAR